MLTSHILLGWAPRSLTSTDECAPRAGHEDSLFVVTGWVRRMRLHESDGDWHIELTEAATTPVTSCIIAEIPAEAYGGIYLRARGALAALADTPHLSPPGDRHPTAQGPLPAAALHYGCHPGQPAGG